MKFKIRFADQIVGLVIILALASVAFVIVMLGQAQRWFAKDKDFSTVLETATGLSVNMAVQYKGFTIGNVKDFRLNADDNVTVTFTIHEDYTRLAREGSIMELQAGIIALLGSQFVFHPGRGQRELADGAEIPLVGSARANELIRQDIATYSPTEDAIGMILSQVNGLLASVNPLLADLGVALGPGTSDTQIGQMIGSLTTTMDDIPQILDSTIEGVLGAVFAELRPILANVNSMLTELNRPDGLVYTLLDPEKEVYTSLVSSLGSVSGILDGLEGTVAEVSAFLPGQLPQIAGLLAELRVTLRTAEDVLEALTNNPLLRGGITSPPENQATGPRDIRF